MIDTMTKVTAAIRILTFASAALTFVFTVFGYYRAARWTGSMAVAMIACLTALIGLQGDLIQALVLGALTLLALLVLVAIEMARQPEPKAKTWWPKR